MTISSVNDDLLWLDAGGARQSSIVVKSVDGGTLDSGGNIIGSKSGTSTMATNQVSVGTTTTLIAAARAGRASITIINGGTTDVFVGNTGVTTTTGLLLTGTKGASVTLSTSAAVYGVVGTGTQVVSYMENY